MQPDNQPNYFQNDAQQPAPVAPPEPVTAPTVTESTETPESMPMYAPEPEEAESFDEAHDLQPENDDDSEPDSIPESTETDEEPVHWSATEYIYQEKGGLWFVIFAVIIIGLIALDIFVLKYYTFSALVLVMAIAVVVLLRRPPTEIDYTLSPEHGLYIGENLRTFDEFKSFGVINDHGNNFIMLVPIKRFGMGVSVYFPTEAGEEIVDILGTRLPMEPLKLSIFDILVRKIRL